MAVLITDADLASARTDAEGEMTDECEIRESTGSDLFDLETGLYTPVAGDLLYAGKCKRQTSAPIEQLSEAGDHVFTEARLSLHIPISAPKIPAGSLALLTACPTAPHDVGQRMRVIGPGGKTRATAQRLNVLEVVG